MARDGRHPIFARIWPVLSRQMDRQGGAERRDQLVAGLAGRVLEVGAGTGVSFDHYPTTVTEVVAVEPEPYLRDEARSRAQEAPVPVHVVDGVAEHLPVDDDSVDAVVSALVLCSVSDQQVALGEIARAVPGRPVAVLRARRCRASRPPRAAACPGRHDLAATRWGVPHGTSDRVGGAGGRPRVHRRRAVPVPRHSAAHADVAPRTGRGRPGARDRPGHGGSRLGSRASTGSHMCALSR